MIILTFTRALSAKRLLGSNSMYKTVYDPTAFIDFFEKIRLERRSSNDVEGISTHLRRYRIETSQKNIQELLKAKEYVVSTSNSKM